MVGSLVMKKTLVQEKRGTVHGCWSVDFSKILGFDQLPFLSGGVPNCQTQIRIDPKMRTMGNQISATV
jgi:hypothetical protein